MVQARKRGSHFFPVVFTCLCKSLQAFQLNLKEITTYLFFISLQISQIYGRIDGRINFTIMENCFCNLSEEIIAQIIVLTSLGWLWQTIMNIRTGLKHRVMVIFRLQSSLYYIRVWHKARQRGGEKEKQRVRERDLPLQKKSLSVYL